MIEEGSDLVVVALTGGAPGPYGVQAAIAALHDEAADVESTDWPQICALYGVLLTLTPSPVVAVNRAVALAMRDGEEVGLTALEELAAEPKLADYHRITLHEPNYLLGWGAPTRQCLHTDVR